jgi:protein TonB
MFGDTLLESSSAPRKGKRWPMATAFTVEIIVAGVLVIIPLLSTGVIPLSAAAPPPIILHPVPLEPIRPVHPVPISSHGSGNPGPISMAVVFTNTNRPAILPDPFVETTDRPELATPPGPHGSNSKIPGDFANEGNSHSTVKAGSPTRIISHGSEALLLNRVEPVYPHIAAITGVQGQVKLHAIIARDGSVQSLNAISGHPLLVRAALDAVGRWRYRPYYLNGEAVEVETFITVNFRREPR